MRGTCARLFRPLASRFVHYLGSHFAAASSFPFAERPPFTNHERIPPAKIRSQNSDSGRDALMFWEAKSFRLPPAGFGLGPAPPPIWAIRNLLKYGKREYLLSAAA
jgi:hypothetical protein